MEDIKFSLMIRLEKEQVFFGPGVAELLSNINTHHSIMAASKVMYLSYAKALKMIRQAEEELNCTLVLTNKGGSQRGYSELTLEGKNLLEKYLNFQITLHDAAQHIFRECFFFDKNCTEMNR